ncbi:MAG TPA: trypsin-like peptidase domain-containing protein [Terriglobales bacterium]|nr:trypsin-like peptidase domain-containing protein [Terriglobales bacterium]
MVFLPDKVSIVEPESGQRDRLAEVLSGAGYQVSPHSAATLTTIVTTMPDLIVMGMNPQHLDCCNLLADVKGSEQARHIPVIMLAEGGPAERVRGLELGADDVLSVPFDDRELLARVRAQLREKLPEHELRKEVRSSKRMRGQARRVLHALNQGRRALRLGLGALAAFILLATATAGFLYWRTQKQNARLYATLARLQAGVVGERDLIELARRTRAEAEMKASASAEAQKQSLKQKADELHGKIASADPSQVADLEKQLSDSNKRLKRLENETTVAQSIIRSYASSVCLLHVSVGFRDKLSNLPLRYTSLLPPSSLPSPGDDVGLQIGGVGAEVRMDAFGTGFLVSSDGRIITNHHVVQPWWKDDEVGELLKQAPNLEAYVADMTAYFPGVTRGIPVKVQKISSDADVAVVGGNVAGLNLKLLAMDDDPKSAISGQPVVLLGYPLAIDAILARTSEDTVRSIAAKTNGDPSGVMAELARQKLIRPTSTQGHIGDVLADKIIYDAQTTSGGSGGPLFNSNGKVIAINVAMLRDFGGSNFAIPVHYAKRLLQ